MFGETGGWISVKSSGDFCMDRSAAVTSIVTRKDKKAVTADFQESSYSFLALQLFGFADAEQKKKRGSTQSALNYKVIIM